MSAAVLVVEDDPLIGSSLCRALRANGYDVSLAGTISDARTLLEGAPPDLLICDLGLPDGDGLDLIESLREARPALPVIALTARGEEADVVAGLASGAVHYATKPFRLAELLATIAAILRFAESRSGSTSPATLQVGDLSIDVGGRRVEVAGVEVELRPKEFDLLVRMAREPGVVLRRETLMADVWDEHWWGSTKTLDVHVHALRRRLGETTDRASRITAIRGVGYRFDGV